MAAPDQQNPRKTDARGTSERPNLLTVAEVAAMLRTSPKGVYAMASRVQLPGVTRIGRRLLIDEDELVKWLRQRSAPSLEESKR